MPTGCREISMLMRYRMRRSKWFNDSLKWLFLINILYCFLTNVLQRHHSPFNVFHQQGINNDTSDERTVKVDRQLLDDLIYHLRDTPYDGVENYIRFMTATRDLKELTGVEPLMPGLGPVINDINWFEYPINLSPCAVTKMPISKSVLNISSSGAGRQHQRSLFVGIISAPQYFERRSMLRQTWPSHLTNQSNIENNPLDVVRLGFVIGLTDDKAIQEKVWNESETYGDILQINMIDTYANLSLKGAGLLRWVDTYCPQVDFVLKVDDDVYVNVHNLATVIHTLNTSEPSVYGYRVGENKPDRIGGKWRTTFEMWPWERLPIYFQGAGLIIAGSAVHSLLSAVQTTPYFIWEDLYLVGLCAVKAKIHLRTSEQIFVDQPENDSDPCFVRNSVMWTTESADRMKWSHFVTHHLYQLAPFKAHCISGNDEIYDEPADAADFPFAFAQQN